MIISKNKKIKVKDKLLKGQTPERQTHTDQTPEMPNS